MRTIRDGEPSTAPSTFAQNRALFNVSVSVHLHLAQFNTMQTAACSLRLAKMMEKVGLGLGLGVGGGNKGNEL